MVTSIEDARSRTTKENENTRKKEDYYENVKKREIGKILCLIFCKKVHWLALQGDQPECQKVINYFS